MLELHNVYVDYMEHKALEDINLTVDEGDFLALFGNDDVGKSVLFHTILGYADYNDGEVRVFGKEISSLKPGDFAKIRFVPDEALVEKMTPQSYFKMAAYTCKAYDAVMQNRLCEAYCIDCEERMDEMTYQDNKLVQIIAAMSACPKLLILDEPRQYLTKETWQMLCEDLKKMNQAGSTIIVSVEKYEDIDGYCNCYACLRDKRIAAVDNIEQGMVYYPAKVVTVSGGSTKPFEDICIKCISDNDNTRSYIYDGRMNQLLIAVARSGCSDWTVEKMSFEEELVGDYSRWE